MEIFKDIDYLQSPFYGCFYLRLPLFHYFLERFTLNIFHDHIMAPVKRKRIYHLGDARMIEGAEYLCFPLEEAQGFPALFLAQASFPDLLDGPAGPLDGEIIGKVDHSIGALSQDRINPEPALQECAGCESSLVHACTSL